MEAGEITLKKGGTEVNGELGRYAKGVCETATLCFQTR